MYDVLVSFIGAPPDGCNVFLYIACVAFTMFLVSEFYSFLRILALRFIDGMKS